MVNNNSNCAKLGSSWLSLNWLKTKGRDRVEPCSNLCMQHLFYDHAIPFPRSINWFSKSVNFWISSSVNVSAVFCSCPSSSSLSVISHPRLNLSTQNKPYNQYEEIELYGSKNLQIQLSNYSLHVHKNFSRNFFGWPCMKYNET